MVIIIIGIFIIDFSNQNIGAHSTTAVVPLIVVTHDETDTTTSKRLVHPSSRVDKKQIPRPSITPINMDNINFKGIGKFFLIR